MMKPNFIYLCWTSGLMTMLLVAIIAINLRLDSHQGKHVWVGDGCNETIETVNAVLSKHQWMDVQSNDWDDFVLQLNKIVPARCHLENEIFTWNAFKAAVHRIDCCQKLDSGFRALLNELELDAAIDDGEIVIGHRYSREVQMIRIYDLPEVSMSSLMLTIERTIEPDAWENMGGWSTMSVLENDFRTRSQLVVRTNWSTHRKLEGCIRSLASVYGWKSYQFPYWLLGKKTSDTNLPPSASGAVSPGASGVVSPCQVIGGRGCCGGMM